MSKKDWTPNRKTERSNEYYRNLNYEVIQEWNEPQITYITSETHYAPIDLSHWSKEDWETFKALIIKYDTKESL